MGQMLSEPITEKASETVQNNLYRVGSSSMQGWRTTMEDHHTHILSLSDDPRAAFFGVYDGHGGASVATLAGRHLHKFVTKRPEYDRDIAEALKTAFLDFDKELVNLHSGDTRVLGSTAVVVLIKENRLYCANAGDSRAIACIKGRLEVLSEDHKPDKEAEKKRIYDAGGFVEYNRVEGNLALSRALGDFAYKQNLTKKPEEQKVIALPDVEVREITEDWEFIVLACDGIWDVMTNDKVLDFCRSRIGRGMPPVKICEELMEHCLAPAYSYSGLGGDNMTVVIVCFLHNKSYEDLACRIRSGVSTEGNDLAASTSRAAAAHAALLTEPTSPKSSEMESVD